MRFFLNSFYKSSACATLFVLVLFFYFSSKVFGFISVCDRLFSHDVILVERAKAEHKKSKRAELEDFVRQVLRSSDLYWQKKFVEFEHRYNVPKVEFFKDKVSSPCGNWHLEMGPFYCYIDETIYIDVSFFEILDIKFGAPGKFAQAYVVGHEVGHHVQNLLNITGPVKFNRSRWVMIRPRKLSLRLELQADCFAGLWARFGVKTTDWLKADQFDEGLRAASQVGDDFVFKNKQKKIANRGFYAWVFKTAFRLV